MKKNVLAVWEALLKQGGSCDVRERALASLLSPPRNGHHHPPPECHFRPPRKCTAVMFRAVQFMNRLRQSRNGLFVNGFTGIPATVPPVTFMPCSSTDIG